VKFSEYMNVANMQVNSPRQAILARQVVYSPPQSAKGTYISGKNDLINITNKPRISALNMDDRDTYNVDVDVVPLDVDLNTRDL